MVKKQIVKAKCGCDVCDSRYAEEMAKSHFEIIKKIKDFLKKKQGGSMVYWQGTTGSLPQCVADFMNKIAERGEVHLFQQIHHWTKPEIYNVYRRSYIVRLVKNKNWSVKLGGIEYDE